MIKVKVYKEATGSGVVLEYASGVKKILQPKDIEITEIDAERSTFVIYSGGLSSSTLFDVAGGEVADEAGVVDADSEALLLRVAPFISGSAGGGGGGDATAAKQDEQTALLQDISTAQEAAVPIESRHSFTNSALIIGDSSEEVVLFAIKRTGVLNVTASQIQVHLILESNDFVELKVRKNPTVIGGGALVFAPLPPPSFAANRT